MKLLRKISTDDRRVRVTALEHLALEAVVRIAAPTYFEPQYAPSQKRHQTSADGGVATYFLFTYCHDFGLMFSGLRVPDKRRVDWKPNRVPYPFRPSINSKRRGKLSRELGFKKPFTKTLT